MEDLDLCYRFAEAGWTTWFEPSVTVIHVKAGTSGEHRSLRLNCAFHYGMFRFYRDHYAARAQPAAQPRGLRRDRGQVRVRGARATRDRRSAQRRSRSERGADPLDRRRVGGEQRLVPGRAGRGRRGSCARAASAGRSAPAGSSVSSSANSSALASTSRESWLPGTPSTSVASGQREQVDRAPPPGSPGRRRGGGRSRAPSSRTNSSPSGATIAT